MSNQSFIESIVPGAKTSYANYGILPSVTIAQAIIESGWGKASPGNNLFGIKGVGPAGSNNLATTEEVSGNIIHIRDNFRAYNSPSESVIDHGKFLAENSRYKGVLSSKTPEEQTSGLQSAGYATESNYASSLMGIIRENNLTQYDNGLGGGGPQGLLADSKGETNSSEEGGIMQNIGHTINNSLFTAGGICIFIFALYLIFK